MKSVEFHPEARAELQAAVRWHEKEQAGLGRRLRQEAKAAIARIEQSPEAFGVISDDIRCHKLHHFH